MTSTVDRVSVFWIERLAITAFVICYLILFSTEILTGDAMVYVDQVQNSNVDWNPNHLLMSPTGNLWHLTLNAIAGDVSATTSLKLFSGLCALISLIIFHAILVALKVDSVEVRLLAVAGLFFSQNFLSMAISEEFFIYQMPFVIAGLLFIVSWYQTSQEIENKSNDLVYAGIVLAFATAVLANGMFLLVLLGISLAIFERNNQLVNIQSPVRLWVGAAIVGFPLFIGGYLMSSYEGSFITWGTSYQGTANNPTQELYGLRLNLSGIFESLARIPFNTIANFVNTGGLGTVLKSIIFSRELEYNPNYFQFLLSALLMLSILGLGFLVALWLLRNIRSSNFLKILLVWLIAFMLFNFFWNDSSDQFWMQILPVCWLLIFFYFGLTNSSLVKQFKGSLKNLKRSRALLAILVVGIALLNTLQFTYPNAYANIEEKSQAYKNILREGDIEIMTGWDDLRWFIPDRPKPQIDKIILMNVALGRDNRFNNVDDLKHYVDNKLKSGHRVVISRLYDLDDTPRPWDQLAKLGWSRSDLKQAFTDYNNPKIGQVGDVVFRQLLLKE